MILKLTRTMVPEEGKKKRKESPIYINWDHILSFFPSEDKKETMIVFRFGCGTDPGSWISVKETPDAVLKQWMEKL